LAALLCVCASPAAAQGRGGTRYQQRVEQELIRLDEEFARAVVRADARALERLLAEDFSATGPDGERVGRKEFIGEIASGDLKLAALTPDDHLVRLYGTAAVVNHGGTMRGERVGRDAGGRYRWTHIFVRRGGRWRCVSSQTTHVVEPSQRPR
jgi:ketosteroid isomerase-like protein